ncbi:hypothetical protein ABZ135_01335 [Streptomyces sp. NPDC006339]|uniref:hypothetical protein n=1 Tax=Streptomyces sp. NPDC006339 TaxID=3156755 RepID=UPI0033ABCDB6
MAWYHDASDADLVQSIELARDTIRLARKQGNKQREEAFTEDLNNFLDEARRRGWKQGSPWPGR